MRVERLFCGCARRTRLLLSLLCRPASPATQQPPLSVPFRSIAPARPPAAYRQVTLIDGQLVSAIESPALGTALLGVYLDKNSIFAKYKNTSFAFL